MHPLLAPDDVAVTAIELRRVRLPFRRALRSAHGIETHRESTIVRVGRADGSHGWGECVALRLPSYTSEYADGAFRILCDVLAPALLASSPATVVGHRMARAALDGAVLDARLRAHGVGLADALGGTRDRVTCAAVIGRAESIELLMHRVSDAVEQGYSHVSLKIEPGWDLEPLSAVRRAWPGLALSADANRAYGVEDRAHLARLDDIGLDHLEQPLPAEDLVGHASLAAMLATPIALDESVVSLASLDTVLALGAARAVNLKPARVGGVMPALAIGERASAAGLALYCGGMLETGVGRAAALALASLPVFDGPTHLGPSDVYFDRDLTPAFDLGEEATMAVPRGVGLGVEPFPDRLEDSTVARVVVGASDD